MLSAILLVASAFPLASVATAQNSQPAKAPRVAATAPAAVLAQSPLLKAKPEKVDFGDVFQGEELVQEVVITNEGDASFPLASIQTSCGCTAAKIIGPDGTEYPSRSSNGDPILILEPEESMTVQVEFDTAGKNGDVKQTMKLHPSDPTHAPLEVGVHVRVTKALQVTPPWLNLNKIPKTGRVEEIVTVEAVAIGEWSISGFASKIDNVPLPTWLQFEVLDDEGPRRRIKVILDGDRNVGAFSTRVAVNIDHERIEQTEFAVTGIVEPNVAFDTGNSSFQDSVNFEHVQEEESVTRTITVVNKDPAVPYMLETVDLLTSQKEFFKTEVRTVEEGVSYEVDITVDGSLGAPFFRGSLILRAQHPDLANKMIPFHGWVQKKGQ